mmetsp:Transcript_45350/g.115156  ORF Transcript_45350/g.115156 Transcript_45350/m.115156 type:complete len:220 (-) Transcript_45350:198-857(-)
MACTSRLALLRLVAGNAEDGRFGQEGFVQDLARGERIDDKPPPLRRLLLVVGRLLRFGCASRRVGGSHTLHRWMSLRHDRLRDVLRSMRPGNGLLLRCRRRGVGCHAPLDRRPPAAHHRRHYRIHVVHAQHPRPGGERAAEQRQWTGVSEVAAWRWGRFSTPSGQVGLDSLAPRCCLAPKTNERSRPSGRYIRLSLLSQATTTISVLRDFLLLHIFLFW